MKILVCFLFLCASLISNVSAQSRFSGSFVQLGIGYEKSTASVGNEVFNDGTTNYAVDSNIKNSKGFNFPLSAGYTFDLADKYTLALGAEFFSSNRTFNVSSSMVNGPDFPASTSSVKNRYAIYIAPGITIDTDTLAYAKIGYSSAKFVSHDGSGDNAQLNGYVLGIGVKRFFSPNAYYYLEGDYTKVRPSSISGSQSLAGTTYSYTYDVRGSTVMGIAGIGYKF